MSNRGTKSNAKPDEIAVRRLAQVAVAAWPEAGIRVRMIRALRLHFDEGQPLESVFVWNEAPSFPTPLGATERLRDVIEHEAGENDVRRLELLAAVVDELQPGLD